MDAALCRDLVRLRDERRDLAVLLDNLHVRVVMAEHRALLLRVLLLRIRLDLRNVACGVAEVQAAEREISLHLAHRLAVCGRLLLRDRLIARALIREEFAIAEEPQHAEQHDDDDNQCDLLPL